MNIVRASIGLWRVETRVNRALLKRLPADAEGAFDGKRPPLFAAPNFERTLKFYNLPPELVALKGLGMFAMVKKAREWFEQRGHDMKGDAVFVVPPVVLCSGCRVCLCCVWLVLLYVAWCRCWRRRWLSYWCESVLLWLACGRSCRGVFWMLLLVCWCWLP